MQSSRKKIERFFNTLDNKYNELLDNPGNLELYLPNAGLAGDQVGHLIKANALKQDLINNIKLYQDKCGGGPGGPMVPSGA